jgi:hypothetical protein
MGGGDNVDVMVTVMVRTMTTDYYDDLMVVRVLIHVIVTDDGEDGDD